MNILTSSLGLKELVITPRVFVFDSFQLTDEIGNTMEQYDIVGILVGEYYATITIDFTDPLKQLIQNRFYILNLYNGLDLAFRGKIFCTDQSVFTYSVNTLNNGTNTYVSRPSTNEYITYGE